MPENQETGSPSRELASLRKSVTEKAPSRGTIMRDNEGWYTEQLPHEKAVHEFQAYIKHMQQLDLDLGYVGERGRLAQPEAILRKKLDWESGIPEEGKSDFYNTLRYAWDALAYDRYEIGSLAESLAGSTLSQYYQHQRATAALDPAVIRLSAPAQVQMLDAMADAVGMTHKKGQHEIQIPEKCVNRLKWVTSPEYEQAFLKYRRADP